MKQGTTLFLLMFFRAMDAPRTGSAANDIAATSSGVCHQAQQGTAIFADEY